MSSYGNDCHFYYNSTCAKGDNCAFRHCEVAKACKVECTFWKQGICSKPNCPYRHAILPPEPAQRNRQAIPCYWENQPIGCSRLNCQYQHFKPRPVIPGGPPLENQPLVSEGHLPDTTIPPPLFGQGPPVSQTVVPVPGAPIIQPVVVQFSDSEVESDKNSPVKKKSAPTTVTSSNKTENSNTISQISSTASQIPNTTPQIATTTPKIDSATSQIAGTSSVNIVVPQTQVKPVPTFDLDYFIGKPFNKTDKSPPRSPVRYYSPDRRSYSSRGSRYSSSRSPSPRNRSISPRYRRSPSPRRSRSPRRRSPYLRDRSRSPRRWSPRRRSPSPRRRTPPRNQITRPQDRYLTSRRPVHERLNRDKDYSSASTSRGREPTAIPSKKISLSKIKDKTDSDDDKIKVKSLEEIQRAKALLSMGLIELQSGKIVKIGDVNKYKEEDTVKKSDDEPKRKKKIVKKASVKVKKTIEKPRLKPKPKVKKVVKKVEKKEEVKSEEEDEDNDDENVEEKEEENLDDGDDLGEEPEIDIGEVTGEFEEPESEEKEDSGEEEEGKEEENEEEEEEEEEGEEQEIEDQESESEPEIVHHTEDIRRAVRKEDVDSKFGSIPKRKRKVIVDKGEKQTTAEIKVSVQSRLGRKLKPTEVKVSKTPKTNSKSGVKSRLSLKNDKSGENVSSSNKTETNRTSGGIKSRLGIGAVKSSTNSESVNSQPKKIVLKRTLETDKKDDKKEAVKKRRWNQSSVKSRLGDSASDTNISSSDLKKIVIVRNIDDDNNSESGLDPVEKRAKTTSQQNQSQVKGTLSRINKIIEDKKEQQGADSGVRLKAWKKLNVWSSRIADTIASTKPTKKESDIDLYDSSSNDSLLEESVLPTKEPKPSRKGPKQERALYVPPGRKRTVTSYDDQEEVNVSPVKKQEKSHMKEKTVKEIKEPETIKTYSQIMEEKRKKLEKQREKKAKAEEKSKKKKISRIAVSDKENENMPIETKTAVENKPVSTVKAEVPVSKTSMLDTFSFSLPDTKESQPQSDKVDSTVEHIELLSTLVTDNSNSKVDDSQERSPKQSASDDNWLDFTKDDLDMTGCDTADDDDLLREIDELLA